MDNSFSCLPTNSEIEFLSENTLIEIIPNFSLPQKLYFPLTGLHIGPFQTKERVTIPLWFAINMKKEKKCQILPPKWLTVKNLQTILEQENETQTNFTKIHQYFTEIGLILLKHAKKDIKEYVKIKKLLSKIIDRRIFKLNQGLLNFGNTNYNLIMKNLTLFEINLVRKLTTYGLKNIDLFGENDEDESDDDESDDDDEDDDEDGEGDEGDDDEEGDSDDDNDNNKNEIEDFSDISDTER